MKLINIFQYVPREEKVIILKRSYSNKYPYRLSNVELYIEKQMQLSIWNGAVRYYTVRYYSGRGKQWKEERNMRNK